MKRLLFHIFFIVLIIFFYIVLSEKPNYEKKIVHYQKSNNIIDTFRKTKNMYPNKKALVDLNTGKELTFSEYWNMCCHFANKLQTFKTKNRVVCTIGYNSMEWFISCMGTLLGYWSFSGIYTTNKTDSFVYILNNCKAHVLVVDSVEQFQKIEPVLDNLIYLKHIVITSLISLKKMYKNIVIYDWKSFFDTTSKINFEKPYYIDGNKTATLIYTSGTTGNPKGVQISHNNINWTLERIVQSISINFRSGRIISYLPSSHIAGQLFDIYAPLLTSSTVYFADKTILKDKKVLVNTLKTVKPTIFVGVPRVWEKIYEGLNKKIGKSLKYYLLKYGLGRQTLKEKLGFGETMVMISAAAPLNKEVSEYLKSVGFNIHQIYGMSETTGPISSTLFGDNMLGVGKVLPGVRVVIDKKTQEILVSGGNLFTGYLGDYRKTLESFNKDGYFKTGDIGKIENGTLYVTGRMKELIITSGGENVSPVPIEDKIKKAIHGLDNCVVVGDRKKFLSVLLFVGKNKINVDLKKVFDKINKEAESNAQTIKKWKVVGDVLSVENEMLTPTLKIKRNKVIKKYNKIISSLY